MKLKSLLAGITLAGAAVLPTACAPGPGPCTHNYLDAPMAIMDNLGNVAARIVVHEDVCITPQGWIVSNNGTQEQHNVGWYAFFDGGMLEEHPDNNAAGPTGGWTADRTFGASWHTDILVGIAGYGYHIGMGSCHIIGHMGSFADHVSLRSITGWCDGLNARPWG